jgi:hypothetical protein
MQEISADRLKRLIGWVIAALILAAMACQSVTDLSQPRKTAWIELSETELQSILQSGLDSLPDEDRLFRTITSVNVQNYETRVSATYSKPDGTISGADWKLRLEIRNSQLFARVDASDLEGVSSDDPRLDALSQSISQTLTQAIVQDHRAVSFDWIENQPDSLRIKISYR